MSDAGRLDLAGFSVVVLSGWHDITDTLEGEPRPWTLAKPDGGGALQFSTARYKGGPVPNPSLEDLQKMVRDFGRTRHLEPPTELLADKGPMSIAGGTYRWQDSVLRIWYISNGRSFIFVTYTADEDSLRDEVADCEAMLRTVRFPEGAGGPTRGIWTPPVKG